MYLLRHDLTLLIDDAHYISTRGLRVLTNLWNAIDASRGHGIRMILVGNELNDALKTVPEIQSRVISRFEAPAMGGEALYAALASIEPRTVHTERRLLQQLDRQHFKGEMRQWVQFFTVLRMQRATTAADDAPIEPTEIRHALLRQGFIQ